MGNLKKPHSKLEYMHFWEVCIMDKRLKGEVIYDLQKYGYGKKCIKDGRKLWRDTDRLFKTQNQAIHNKNDTSKIFKASKELLFWDCVIFCVFAKI
ncbi:MAG: hypothetical protein OIF50_16760 [Flavobacteriaceae bacterium]|nr:hypothetical protein [Flavobacteriaceae bacterium]